MVGSIERKASAGRRQRETVEAASMAPKSMPPSIPELAAELAEVERQIADAYWRFSHSPSPRVGPPSADLYRRRTELKDAINGPRPMCDDCGTRPRSAGFLVCEKCWNERGRNERPLMPWEMGT